MAGREVVHPRGDLCGMGFVREMPAIDEMDFGVRQVAGKGACAIWPQEGIVLALDGNERRLVFRKVDLQYVTRPTPGLIFRRASALFR